MQSTTSFDVSDAQGYKVDGYTTVDLLGSYQLPVGTLSFSIENLFDRDYHCLGAACTTVLQPGLRPSVTVRLQRQGPNLWSELLCAVLTGMLLQQGYAVNNMVLGGHVVYSQYNIQP